ncbi:MAG: hypothetical protein Q6373_008710 [Candidatus Sigynarchaeota archaeon]
MMVKQAAADGSILAFVEEITRVNADPALVPKIQKAIAMFKKERNLLYIDGDPVAGTMKAVIKSQTHPDELEYAVFLNKAGNFFCTTQNLRPCGGLRGQICKHIVLGLIALVKSGTMDCREISGWVKLTSNNRPVLDKDEATRIFLKYKNALDGKLDWRPIEILPEDFMAV